jgi:thiol-disulfide isomerase/thioredoxin
MAALSALSALSACAPQPARTTAITSTAALLPDVPLTTLADQPTRLPLVVGHRPALIALWATWCDACRAERPSLERLDRAATARGGVVVGVAVGETSDVVREDLRRHPTGYPQLVDEPFAFADALGVHTLPTVLVLDAEGRVVHEGGALDHAALAAFRRVLREQ